MSIKSEENLRNGRDSYTTAAAKSLFKESQSSARFQFPLFPELLGLSKIGEGKQPHKSPALFVNTSVLIYPRSPTLKNSAIICGNWAKHAAGLTTDSSNISCPFTFGSPSPCSWPN
jgi:hypothetical protein